MRFLAIPIVVLAIILFFRTSDRTAAERDASPAFRTSAVSLSTAYFDDPVAADRQYRDRLVQVTGDVARVEQDMAGQLAIILQGGQSLLSGVECQVAQAQIDEVKVLRSGQRILVKGYAAGKTTHVRLSGCALLHADSLDFRETVAGPRRQPTLRSLSETHATRRVST